MSDKNFWSSPLTRSAIRSDKVRLPEMLIGYFIGPFGALLSSGIFTSMLNKYLVDVLQMDTGFLSGLQLVSTVLIVISNLVVGQLIERTRALAGKARPWILLSALTLSVASVLMFIVPFGGLAKIIWVAVAYNLYYAVAYPIYNTANSTLIPVSTRDSSARGTLASFTNIAGLAVMGCGSMVFPILASNVLGNDQSRWFVVMLAVALFTALTVLLQYKFTRERVTEENLREGVAEPAKESVTLAAQFKAVASEKWWWLVMAFYLVFQWSGAIKNGSMAHFCQYVLGGSMDWGVAQSLLGILGAIPMAIASVLVVPLANKFGKRIVCMVGMFLGAAGGVVAGLGGSNIIPVAIGVALKCLGSAPACYLILAMLADVIDHVEYKHGIRTDGLTMSIYSSLMVAATPIMNAVFMALLGGAGYDAAQAVQSAAAQGAISVSYIWIETIAYAAAAALIFFFTVEKVLPEEQKAIAERKGLNG